MAQNFWTVLYSFVDLTLRVFTVSNLTLRMLKSCRRPLLREKFLNPEFYVLREMALKFFVCLI